MSWRGPWLSLVLLCTGVALAQLPPRGVTPTPTRPRQTPPPTIPAPVATPAPSPTTTTPTGIYTQWRVTVEYRETPDGPWKVNSTQYEEGSDRKVMTLTLWRYR